MSEPRLLINRLYLQSVKSYREADIPLPAGTIAICGTNGAGKSTLIEAIGFALFGSQRVRQEQLIREGEAHGRIEVSFTSGLDGLTYTVTRELRRTGAAAARLYSEAHGFNVAAGVREVQAEVAQHLGARDGVSLDTLFNGVIGVPQGQLTSDFLLTATPRRARFEELLALQEFNLAYQRLAGPLGFGRDRLANARGRLSMLEQRIEDSRGVRAELVRLQAGLGEAQRQATALEKQLAAAKQQRAALDEAEAGFGTVRRRLAEVELASRLAEQQVRVAQRRWEESAGAAALAEASRAGHDRWLALEDLARELDRDRKQRDLLRRDLSELDTGLAGLQSTIEGLAKRVEDAAAARAEADRLRPAAAKQAQIDSLLREAHGRLNLRAELEAQLAIRTASLSALAERERVLAAGAGAVEAAEQAVLRAEGLLESARNDDSEVTAAGRSASAELESRRQAEEAVRRGEASACPVCQRPFAEGDAQGFLRHLREEIAGLERSLAGLRERSLEARRLVKVQKQALEQAQQALERARADASALQAIREQRSQADADIAALRERLTSFAGLEAETAALDSQLRALGDPQSRLRVAEALAAQYDDLSAELDETRARATAAAQKRRELMAETQAYADLDDRLAETVAARDECREAFDDYRRFAPLAAELEQRLAELNRSRADHASRVAELAATTEEVTEAESRYNRELHEAARRQERDVEIRLTRLQAEIEADTGRLADAATRLAELERLEEERRQLVASCGRDERTGELLAFLRDTIRGAGPEIARLVLARVSRAATVTYAELMSDHASTLTWGSDYGITIERAGLVRDFVQLSGGEQVSAALSVRLALLREVSELRIAFFDEPTINLDEHRRRGLADQMRSIRDLDQLFVISHDDSLESVTDNVIYVRKEDGQSLLEPA